MDTNPEKVIRLVEEMTRMEIMARLGPFGGGVDWYSKYLKKKDELQEYLFGSSDYVKLGIQWGMLRENKKENKKQKFGDVCKGEFSETNPSPGFGDECRNKFNKIVDDSILDKLSGFNMPAKDMFDVNKMLEEL